MAVTIPAQSIPGLTALVQLSADQVDALDNALREVGPVISVAALVRKLRGKVTIPAPALQQIIVVLLSLSLTLASTRRPLVELIDGVVAALPEQLGELRRDSALDQATKARLLRLLSSTDTLGITGRALDVLFQHKNPYKSARILTDIRPVFSTAEPVKPAAAMIVHNLEVVTRTDGENLSHFIAMDTQDLVALRAVVDRAIAKQESLRAVIENSGLTYLEVESPSTKPAD